MPKGIANGGGRPRSSDSARSAVRRERYRDARAEAAAARAESADPVPEPESDLSAFDQAIWRRLAGCIEDAGTYRKESHELFRLLVASVADLERARGAEGVTLGMLTTARRAVASLLIRFGLDPSARAPRTTALDDEVEALSKSPAERLKLVDW